MTDDPQKKVDRLEPFFKAARENPETPDPEFVAKLMADVDANFQPRAAVSPPAKTGFWPRITQNWLPASGLTAATAFGLWIGILLPDTQIADAWLTGNASDVDLAVFLPGVDLSQFFDPETDG